MTQRLAAVAALLVFTVCLLVGGFAANNPFVTSVERALVAMLATLGIGLIVGWMAQKMLQESVAQSDQSSQNAQPGAAGMAGAAGGTDVPPSPASVVNAARKKG
jgi:hypothetical protein